MALAEFPKDLYQPGQNPALKNRKAEDLVGLPQDYGQRHSIQKAHQDGPRQEVGERA